MNNIQKLSLEILEFGVLLVSLIIGGIYEHPETNIIVRIITAIMQDIGIFGICVSLKNL